MDKSLGRATEINGNSLVKMEVLSNLTGFPTEMIQRELFHNDLQESVSLNDLRSAMLSLIDKTLLQDVEEKN